MAQKTRKSSVYKHLRAAFKQLQIVFIFSKVMGMDKQTRFNNGDIVTRKSTGKQLVVSVHTVRMTDGREYTTTSAQVLRNGKPSGRSYRIYEGNENEFVVVQA